MQTCRAMTKIQFDSDLDQPNHVNKLWHQMGAHYFATKKQEYNCAKSDLVSLHPCGTSQPASG